MSTTLKASRSVIDTAALFAAVRKGSKLTQSA
ncbi:hypothetical protein CGERO_00835 [Corynebacterium gerontici]|uniref:Uncharacterized protein n=1 Tax=Corynebacterium gerontici TaxID=2079234 RepID=A0A3G6IXT9_9CORY|nr:hypothetical protein CGERO_00835 [Corynebacterium gerontici]